MKTVLLKQFQAEEGDDGNALKDTDDFEREKYFTSIAVEGARIGVIKAKRAKLPLLRPDGMI